MELAEEEREWLKWADTLPPLIQKDHEGSQVASLRSFNGGRAAERARIRREWASWFWSHTSEGDRTEDFMSALDRICPEE